MTSLNAFSQRVSYEDFSNGGQLLCDLTVLYHGEDPYLEEEQIVIDLKDESKSPCYTLMMCAHRRVGEGMTIDEHSSIRFSMSTNRGGHVSTRLGLRVGSTTYCGSQLKFRLEKDEKSIDVSCTLVHKNDFLDEIVLSLDDEPFVACPE